MSILHKFQMAIFPYCLRNHTVGHAGSPTGTVHADMTLTRSKVKVKVTGLWKFLTLPQIALF